MSSVVIGRDDEKAILDDTLLSPVAELVAIYGRRRVGKTYLVRSYLENKIVFEFTGIHNVSTAVQLENFTETMARKLNNNKPLLRPNTWFGAFDLFKTLLKKKTAKKKAVIFFDEFPWLQTPKSNFLAAFENFWNTWACLQTKLVIVLCGSAASWMIKNVVRNRGGLHNRITKKIALQPFSLAETQLFLIYKKITLNPYQIIQIYMAFGGIPHYLNQVKPGLSAAQIIDAACFTKTGFLFNEFNDLYQALFDTADRHLKVVKALASRPAGLSRNELIKTCSLQSGGSTTTLLEELSASGFITAYIPFGRQTKDAIFKLTDEYSLFYLKFMESNRIGTKGTWLKLSDTPGWKSWSGLAFEGICFKHVPAIKNALGISGIYAENSVWKSKAVANGSGAQIDLIINRRDNSINLCEIKYYENDFAIDKRYAIQLENKKRQFRLQTRTKKQLFITLITTYPIEKNVNSIGLIDQNITMDMLFL